MVKNEEGLIAVQHYSSNPWDVEVKRSGQPSKIYNFRPSHNVSMAWVTQEDLDKILAITVKACCGKHQKRFFLASQTNVNLFETGDRVRRTE